MATEADIARLKRIAPEFAQRSDLADWLDDAVLIDGRASVWGDRYSYALVSLAAHMITLAERGSRQDGGPAGGTGVVGRISSHTSSQGATVSAVDTSSGIDPELRLWLATTRHGEAYLSLLLGDTGNALPMVVTPLD